MIESKIACVFPGQGSQKQGMLADFSENRIVRDTFTEASDVLGYDVWDLIQNDSNNQLSQTEYTQPAMMVSDVAVYRLFQKQFSERFSGSFAFMAGHSLGEYAALVCADSISLADATFLVKHRGRLMQEIIPEGAGSMAAIVGLTDEQVVELCKKVANHQVLEAANFNSVGQVVIAGDTEAVDRAINLALEEGAKLAKVIPVSVPCHCYLLYPVAEASTKYLEKTTIRTPTIPVIHNVHADLLQEPEEIRDILKKQLYQPVQWVATIRKMVESGVTKVVECGPGSVLTGLNKRIDRSIQCMSIFDQASLEKVLNQLGEE
jgi:[acyl-carrier-protein] S-malonyltransferase